MCACVVQKEVCYLPRSANSNSKIGSLRPQVSVFLAIFASLCACTKDTHLVVQVFDVLAALAKFKQTPPVNKCVSLSLGKGKDKDFEINFIPVVAPFSNLHSFVVRPDKTQGSGGCATLS